MNLKRKARKKCRTVARVAGMIFAFEMMNLVGMPTQAWAGTTKEADIQYKEIPKEELEHLGKELIGFPKKRRLRYGGNFEMVHNTNPTLLRPHHEESDTEFKMQPFVALDLSGRRTTIQLEFDPRWIADVKRSVDSGNNRSDLEGNLRVSRRLAKKTTFSLNHRLTQNSARSGGMSSNKITWTNFNRANVSYQITPKFSAGLESDYSRTDLTHYKFDKASTFQYHLEPSLFFYLTPKTRLALGYRWGVTRTRLDTSDVNSNEIRFGYFGKITPKSSATIELTYAHNDKNAFEATRLDKIEPKVGYIWQMTPKTSLRVIYTHPSEHTLSEALQTAGNDNVTIRTVTYTNTDNLQFTLRFLVNRRVNTEFSFDGRHTRGKTFTDGLISEKTRQWLFPAQVVINYQLARWMTLRFSYTFTYKTGNERRIEEFRVHTWLVGTNISL